MRRRDVRLSVEKISTLKVDKDCFVDGTWIEGYVRAIIQICNSYGIKVLRIQMCHSKRKGQHFYVTIEPALEANRANYLQYLLGDDCQRVDFNRARIESSLNEWNKLFEVVGRRLRTIYTNRGR